PSTPTTMPDIRSSSSPGNLPLLRVDRLGQPYQRLIAPSTTGTFRRRRQDDGPWTFPLAGLSWIRRGGPQGCGKGGGGGVWRGEGMDEVGGDRSQIAVFLLDDHEIVRRGVRELLEAEPDITVIGEAGTAESALGRIPALKPDVAVLDVRLPDGNGVTVCREIRSKMPEVACLMLTSFGDDEALFDAIMAGAAGYVLKQIRGTDLVGAVRTIASGRSLLDPEAAARVMRRMREQAHRSDPLSGLTDQERRILELIG